MEFSRAEHWSGQPFPPPGGLPNPGIQPKETSVGDSGTARYFLKIIILKIIGAKNFFNYKKKNAWREMNSYMSPFT